jgi:hypothetical protein
MACCCGISPFRDVMDSSPSHNFPFLDPKKHKVNNKLKLASYLSSTSTSCHSPPYIYFFLMYDLESLFSYEVLLTLDKEKHQFYSPIYYYVFNSLLFSLLVLHIYWWILIYRMLVKQIQSKGRVGDDVRSGN